MKIIIRMAAFCLLVISAPFFYVSVRMLGDAFVRGYAFFYVQFSLNGGKISQFEIISNFYKGMLWSGELVISLASTAIALFIIAMAFVLWRVAKVKN